MFVWIHMAYVYSVPCKVKRLMDMCSVFQMDVRDTSTLSMDNALVYVHAKSTKIFGSVVLPRFLVC